VANRELTLPAGVSAPPWPSGQEGGEGATQRRKNAFPGLAGGWPWLRSGTRNGLPLLGSLLRLPLRGAFRAFLLAILILCSAGMIYATRQSIETAERLGARAMERTGLALAASVENALRDGKSGDELREILSDRVVAYALIAGSDGTIRFHVNPELVGTHLSGTGPGAWTPPAQPVARRIMLGVGTPAYQYDYPLLAPGGAPETLRVVLHLGEVDRLGASSRRLWGTVVSVLAVLTFAGVGLDRLLTRLLTMHEEMDRRKRLSLVGQMTATLAHEIRNALWGVKGYAQWIDEKLPEASPCKPDVTAILQGTGRIEGLVDDLLLYARDETYRIERVSLASLVHEACSAAATGWKGSLEVEVDPSLFAWADGEKLHRVLVNGLRNALQAMGDGVDARLTIAAGRSGESSWLRLEDTGGGIPPEVERWLFTPFYTTKADGTGLGLAYSRKVVEGMKGTIDLENGANGAILTLRLPGARKV
jgi:two-component system sensor histidine kinase HydH